MIDPDWLAPLARGLWVTLQVFVGAAAVAVLSAVLLGLAGAHGTPTLRLGCRAWVELLRGTSALVQLFWVVFALPLVGVRVDPLIGGALVLGLNCGAYAAEAVRGALLALPRGQHDAAAVLGFGFWQRVMHLELPQIAPVVLPVAANLAIELLKNTSLVSLIGLADLTFQAGVLRTATLADLPILSLLLGIYLVLALGLAQLGQRAERSCARWYRGAAA